MKQTIEILLIRHGETDWNRERRLQGHLDIPLNAQGNCQATALGQALLKEPLDAIVASDLQRARQTAQAIATPRQMHVQIDSGLRERCFGAFEGLQHHEIQARYPEAYAAWQAREPDARHPDGLHRAETLREFSVRALNAIARLTASLPHCRKIAIVTHGGVLDCAYRSAKQSELSYPRDFEIPNASINRLSWDGATLHILQWADVAHLKQPVLDEIEQ